MSPWTPLGSAYSRTESHCWWGHHSRPEGGSQFIRAGYQELREERSVTSCGDSKLLNSAPLPKGFRDLWKDPKGAAEGLRRQKAALGEFWEDGSCPFGFGLAAGRPEDGHLGRASGARRGW